MGPTAVRLTTVRNETTAGEVGARWCVCHAGGRACVPVERRAMLGPRRGVVRVGGRQGM